MSDNTQAEDADFTLKIRQPEEPTELTFIHDGQEVGRFYTEDGVIKFEGGAALASKIFVDHCIKHLATPTSSPTLQDIIEVVEGLPKYSFHTGEHAPLHICVDDLLAKLKALQSDAPTGNNQTEAGE
jgi:hypothetical protein